MRACVRVRRMRARSALPHMLHGTSAAEDTASVTELLLLFFDVVRAARTHALWHQRALTGQRSA
jgi:hypothetical protein